MSKDIQNDEYYLPGGFSKLIVEGKVVEIKKIEASKVSFTLTVHPTQKDELFCDALVCDKCGQIVERGIVSVSDHYQKCGSLNLSPLNDAEFEVIEPKKINQKL